MLPELGQIRAAKDDGTGQVTREEFSGQYSGSYDGWFKLTRGKPDKRQ